MHMNPSLPGLRSTGTWGRPNGALTTQYFLRLSAQGERVAGRRAGGYLAAAAIGTGARAGLRLRLLLANSVLSWAGTTDAMPASSPGNMSWMELIASSGAGAVFAGGALLAVVGAGLSAAWCMVSRVRESWDWLSSSSEPSSSEMSVRNDAPGPLLAPCFVFDSISLFRGEHVEEIGGCNGGRGLGSAGAVDSQSAQIALRTLYLS